MLPDFVDRDQDGKPIEPKLTSYQKKVLLVFGIIGALCGVALVLSLVF